MGRVTKPTANVPSDASKLEVGELEGKNVLPMYTAKNA
jgi:hypothetical protein